TIVRDLRPALVGRTFREVRLRHDDVLRGVKRAGLIRRLTGATVDEVSRRAKHVVLRLGRWRLVIQPGMTGSLFLVNGVRPSVETRYDVLTARLDDWRDFVYRDVRRLGSLLLLDESDWRAYDAAIGPEPLDPQFTPEAFRNALGRTRQVAKKALMDQRLLAGVGNIYANEALFAAGIDPSRPADDLSPEESVRLFDEVRRLLNAAIAANGTTFRDYRTATGQPGNFQLELLVYGREGEPCRRCGTRLAGTHALDARITVFCYRCQR
ncbi:MAG TPA: bifunctional DNA-formamidopyrimidine glycosylase/DNA-(apurinic or apyrimidinic site) lyase, partial [Streptosporangiaceae bacterium]|nr:bifunctional DNA-formamidopyrimidine glycosylase/DNA-(apurinic or apyrimidinic site) lyase [Streptosporangiaceae bacterium]